MNVVIKHKFFPNHNDFDGALDRLTNANIITAVNRRITQKYVQLPFSIRIRPYTTHSWRMDENSVITENRFITVYIDENVTLPLKIANTIASMSPFTRETTGILNHFTYFGEILPSFRIHCGFFRLNHFLNKEADSYQDHNRNLFLVIKCYDPLTIEQITANVTQISKSFTRGWGYHEKTIQLNHNFEVQCFEVEEVEYAQAYYEALLREVKDKGEIPVLSNLVINVTDFGPVRLKTLLKQI